MFGHYYVVATFDSEAIRDGQGISGRSNSAEKHRWGPFTSAEGERECALGIMSNLASRDHVLSVLFEERTEVDGSVSGRR